MNVTLHQLRAFLAVAQYGSFTRAGEHMFISQPSLTLLVKQLEAELGVRLLDRTTRHVELTRAGLELLPFADRIFSELGMAVDKIRELTAVRRGHVTVGALPSAAAGLLPEAIHQFNAAHPGVSVTLKDAVATQLVDMVRAGDVDFCVASHISVAPDIELTPIARDRMHLVCRADHPLAGLAEAPWRALLPYPFIAMNAGTSVRYATDSAFAALGVVKMPDHEVTLPSTTFALAKAGVGVTALPTMVLRALNAEGVACIPLVAPVIEREIGLLFQRERTLSAAAIALMGCICAAASSRDQGALRPLAAAAE